MSTDVAFGQHVEHSVTAKDSFGVVAWVALVAAYLALRAVRRPVGGKW